MQILYSMQDCLIPTVLSINKYKEVVYEKVEYEPTDVIMGKIEAIEAEIQTEFAELKELLNIK
ncbi:hypothetical protein bpr_I1941 [Butyrivibrio proteoclasticus B316]|uniref:Uncharacterized protein n=2 Tax=Butyrivibrio proteoclasticus TaxID=43305 RepID=E0RXU9_BUTPB|nr:hypothetical protein bpr_I1941 [Butyrivibrio proteoclasticus B316]